MTGVGIHGRNETKRRGTILVFAVLFLAILGIFAAFAVDLGHISHAKSEMQNAVDSAARAGVRGLYKSPTNARNVAIAFAAKNNVGTDQTLTLTTADIEIGIWNENTSTFTLLTGSAESAGNAVRVKGTTTIDLFFARLFGNQQSNLECQSIAMMRPKICGAFVGIDNATIVSTVDSYVSANGSYASQTPRANGDVCSNGTINVSQGQINGDARPGIGNGVNVTGGGHVTGSIQPHLPYTYPPIDFGNADVVNHNSLIDPAYIKQGGLSISSSGSTTFSGGVLYFRYMSINGEFRITAPTTIYVEEYVEVSGQGLVNDTFIPSNLRVFILNADNKQSKVTGNGAFYGILYAPYTNLKIAGNGDFFGAAIAKLLTVGNTDSTTTSAAHFDESITPFHESLVSPKIVQ